MARSRPPRPAEVDPARAAAVVRRWTDAGFTCTAIASAAGLARTTVSDLLVDGQRTLIEASTERALLAVTERLLLRDSGYLPVARVRDHVVALKRAGASASGIARAAGVDVGVVLDALGRSGQPLLGSSVRKLLKVTADRAVAETRLLPAGPARLRCRQLQARGWPLFEQARLLGQASKVPSPLRADSNGYVTPEVDTAIRDLWLELRYQRGPSGRAERDARRAGYYPAEAYDARGRLCRPWLPLVAADPASYPPAAYDDDGTVHVDWLRTDEGEALAAVREHKEQVAERRREVLRLTELGWAVARIAGHLGCSRDTVHADRKRVPGREETAA